MHFLKNEMIFSNLSSTGAHSWYVISEALFCPFQSWISKVPREPIRGNQTNHPPGEIKLITRLINYRETYRWDDYYQDISSSGWTNVQGSSEWHLKKLPRGTDCVGRFDRRYIRFHSLETLARNTLVLEKVSVKTKCLLKPLLQWTMCGCPTPFSFVRNSVQCACVVWATVWAAMLGVYLSCDFLRGASRGIAVYSVYVHHTPPLFRTCLIFLAVKQLNLRKKAKLPTRATFPRTKPWLPLLQENNVSCRKFIDWGFAALLLQVLPSTLMWRTRCGALDRFWRVEEPAGKAFLTF